MLESLLLNCLLPQNHQVSLLTKSMSPWVAKKLKQLPVAYYYDEISAVDLVKKINPTYHISLGTPQDHKNLTKLLAELNLTAPTAISLF